MTLRKNYQTGKVRGWTLGYCLRVRRCGATSGDLSESLLLNGNFVGELEPVARFADYVMLFFSKGKISAEHLNFKQESLDQYHTKEQPNPLYNKLTPKQQRLGEACLGVETLDGLEKYGSNGLLVFLFPADCVLKESKGSNTSVKGGEIATTARVGGRRKVLGPSYDASACLFEKRKINSASPVELCGVGERTVSMDVEVIDVDTSSPSDVDDKDGDIAFAPLRSAIRRKDNVHLQGCAGSGKTLAINKIIIEELGLAYSCEVGDKSGSIWVTSTTGLSAANLRHGCTIHQVSGVGLGVGSVQDIMNGMKTRTKNAWRVVKAIVIDEAFMLGGELFKKLNVIAQVLRGNTTAFGGIQMILVGDLLQMTACSNWASVPSIEKVEVGQLFDTPVWNELNFQLFRLTKSHRQGESELFKCLNLISTMVMKSEQDMNGAPSIVAGTARADAVAYLQDFFSPLMLMTEIKEEQLLLNCTKEDVNKRNAKFLDRLTGKVMQYGVHDIDRVPGDSRFNAVWESIVVPSKLELKEGARVLLVKNMKGLANGARGVVVGFAKGEGIEGWFTQKKLKGVLLEKARTDITGKTDFMYPVVEFVNANGIKVRKVIMPHEFTIPCAVTGNTIVSRIALPLLLSYSLTVHKAQGMTLDKVVLDLSKAFCYGQIYTALSRVRHKEDIGLLYGVDFSSCVLANPLIVAWIERQAWQVLELG